MVRLISRYGGLVFGIDQDTEITGLPVVPDDMIPLTGRSEQIPAWSFALSGTGKVYWFSGTVWALFGEE